MPKRRQHPPSPKNDAVARLRRLAKTCRAYERRGLVQFGTLAALIETSAQTFDSLGHEPALWLLTVAAVARQWGEALALQRVAKDEGAPQRRGSA